MNTRPPTTELISPLSVTAGSSRSPKQQQRKRPAENPQLEKLERMLDLTQFLDQVKRLIDQPIKIPGSLTIPNNPRHRQTPEKQEKNQAKRDLLSVEHIWKSHEEQLADVSKLYNTNVGEERKWLLNLLMEESDPDSGGDEAFTEEDVKELLKIHKKRRKFQKEYHNENSNSYTYYGAGLISMTDFYPEYNKPKSDPQTKK